MTSTAASVFSRLEELGVVLPEVSIPVGAYLPALRIGDMVYTSGQLPLVNSALAMTGKVGAEVSPEAATELARTAAVNALAAIHAEVGLENVRRVVKVVGYVASDPAFTGQPAVINGASDLLVDVFGENGRHVRAAVGVAALPLDAPVEVECVVQVH